MKTISWQTQDRKLLRRINALIKDIERTGEEGFGKPEPLKHGFHGYWSRRISDEHRSSAKSPSRKSALPRAGTITKLETGNGTQSADY